MIYNMFEKINALIQAYVTLYGTLNADVRFFLLKFESGVSCCPIISFP